MRPLHFYYERGRMNAKSITDVCHLSERRQRAE